MPNKIKSHKWDEGEQFDGIKTLDFAYDVSENLKNTLFVNKHAYELEPYESLELAKWLFLNSIRPLLAGALMDKDNKKLDEISNYCSLFIKEIGDTNLDFNAKNILTKQHQNEIEHAVMQENIRKLATAAACDNDDTRNELLSDPKLIPWLKNVFG